MKFKYFLRTVCLGLFTISFSSMTNASVISAEELFGDAHLTLTLEDTLTIGVNQSWGSVRIFVDEFNAEFTSGDTVDISVFEDDAVSDDLIWQTSFTVTPGEVLAGLVDRTFLLIFTPAPDDNNNAEIFADAFITKAACFICGNDRPITSNLNVALVSPVPAPAALWLFGTALLGLAGFGRRRKAA